MKYFLFIFMFIILVGCDPYNFGFEKNPATILDQILNSIQSKDLDHFVEATDKEALCTYGNEQAIAYLNDKVKITSADVIIKWKTKEGHLKVPEFVGYWSYYSSRFLIDVVDKKSAKKLAQVVVDCHYGGGEEKNNDLLNLRPAKYRTKECRLVKIVPATFEALPLPGQCASVKVVVNETEFTATASSDSHE